MAARKGLAEEDRAFFALLADTIFSNPFSAGHERVQRLLGEYLDRPAGSQAESYERLTPVLEARLDRLEAAGIRTLQDVRAADYELLRWAHLFRHFQRSVHDFDRLIREQERAGDEPVPVPFAEELIRALHGRGFPLPDCHRLLALYYQLRRAYYFIDVALVGASRPMHGLRKALWNAVFTADVRVYGKYLWDRMEDFSTLLLGETGTGKGSAAAAIGRSGLIPYDPERRRFARSFTGTFLAINLSQFPESLIESELFGHRKGAFTGAVDHHKGVFERCSARGALFLDEIGDVTEPVQIKLLNVLQERRYTPVGSHESRRFAGRVIAATNRPLDELRRSGRFRDDFYYRLSSNVIRVPALRERLADAPGELVQLTGALLARLVGEEAAPQLLEQVLRALQALPRDYAWPGNVRELEQAIRRILVTGSYAPEPPPQVEGDDAWLAAAAAGRLDAGALLGGYCARLYRALGSYEAVARRVGLDRRTVRRHVEQGAAANFGARPRTESL